MKATVENMLVNAKTVEVMEFVEILNLITNSDNEHQLRTSMSLYSSEIKYFEYRFGKNHLWVSRWKRRTFNFCRILRRKRVMEERKTLNIELPQFPSAVISEDSQNYYVDLRTGLGEGIYPKDSFSLNSAIQDQINL